MKCIIISFFLLFPQILNAYTIFYFDKKPIFKESYSYYRAPDSAFTINLINEKHKTFAYVEASLGREVPFATLILDDKTSYFQTGIEAFTWVTVGNDGLMFPLYSQDFLIGLPVYFNYNRFAFGIKYNHISAHLGDGAADVVGKQFPKNVERKNYSREFVSFHSSYRFMQNDIDFKFIGRMGFMIKTIPDFKRKFFLGGSFETKFSLGSFLTYYSQDVTYNGDVNSLDLSFHAGPILSEKDDFFEVRLATFVYIGSDRRGQVFNKKLQKCGLGFFVR